MSDPRRRDRGSACWLLGPLLIGLGAAELARGAPAAATLRFADATPGSGIDYVNVCGAAPAGKRWLIESMGAGAAWLDYDGDGHLDLYLVNGSTYDRPRGTGQFNRLYRGDGRGKFRDVTAQAGVGGRGWGFGVAVGDVDNDGDPDLYVTNDGPNVLYRNNGDGTFADVTAKAGVAGEAVWSSSAAFFDLEADGDLDLYVGNYMESDIKKVPPRATGPSKGSVYCTYLGLDVSCGPLGQEPKQDVLYRNNGDGTFSDVTRESGVWLETPRYALGVVTGDYDNDGRTDVYVANDSVSNSLWRNLGGGKMVDVGLEMLVALNGDGRPQAGMGTDFGDYNGDGWLDLVVTNFSQDLNTIYTNHAGKYFTDDSLALGLGITNMLLSWGTEFHDFDHDGDLDLFIANGHVYPQVDDHDVGTTFKQPNQLFLNQGGKFVEVHDTAGPGLAPVRSFRGAAFGDYDRDGDVDLIVTALDEPALLLRNDTAPRGHWLGVRLIGKRSNRDAIGARVTATVGGRRMIRERKGGGSYLSSSAPELHFGLGAATRVEALEVRWPSGLRETIRDVPADRVVTIEEGSGRAR